MSNQTDKLEPVPDSDLPLLAFASQNFTTDSKIITDPVELATYNDFFASHQIPSKNRIGIVLDLLHSWPVINGNHFGFAESVLKRSYKSVVGQLVDLNHDRSFPVGSILKADLVSSNPITLRVAVCLWRDKLEQNDIQIEDIINFQWSMEALHRDFSFCTQDRVIGWEQASEAVKNHIDKILQGYRINDEKGKQIYALIGDLDETIEFHGAGLITEGRAADRNANTLQVCASKNKNNTNKNVNIFL